MTVADFREYFLAIRFILFPTPATGVETCVTRIKPYCQDVDGSLLVGAWHWTESGPVGLFPKTHNQWCGTELTICE